MAEVFLTISNKCLQRHSKRPTAKEVYRICYNVCLVIRFLIGFGHNYLSYFELFFGKFYCQ